MGGTGGKGHSQRSAIHHAAQLEYGCISHPCGPAVFPVPTSAAHFPSSPSVSFHTADSALALSVGTETQEQHSRRYFGCSSVSVHLLLLPLSSCHTGLHP